MARLSREDRVPCGRVPRLEAVEDPSGVADVAALGVGIYEGVTDGSGQSEFELEDPRVQGLAAL